MTKTLLRERVPGKHAEVTFVELFFDLVFVFAVTQVSHGLLAHPSWGGAVEAAILLMAVWWAWVYTAWITNWLDPGRAPVRLMLFVLMGLGLVMASALPEAFGERGLAFAAAYVAFQLGRTIFALWATRRHPPLCRNFIRVAIWMCGLGALWIAGGIAEGPTRIALWLLALGLDYASPATGFWVPRLGATDTHDWNLEGSHLAERCALFTILCLGESILVTGGAFAETVWTPPVVSAMAVALAGSVAMWWIYFGKHAAMGSQVIAASDDPGRLARTAYTYVPILMVAGIVVSAVGDELILAHPLGHADATTVTVLIGGPALFLLGALLFKFSLFGVWSPPRLVGLGLLALLVPVAGLLPPLGLAAAAAAILALVPAWELLWSAPSKPAAPT